MDVVFCYDIIQVNYVNFICCQILIVKNDNI